MRPKLFWQLSLTFLGLLLAAVLAVDLYTSRVARREYLRISFEELEILTRLSRAQPPSTEPAAAQAAWVSRMAQGGARVTIVAADGRVLADSAEDPAAMEDHSNRPEIQQALATGEGRAVRRSPTLGRELIYLALRLEDVAGQPIVLRFARPLQEVDEQLGEFRRRLWVGWLVVLLFAAGFSFIAARRFSSRIERLKEFSARVAGGNFTPLPVVRRGDEVDALGRTLNDTAAQLDRTIRSLTDERNRTAAILSSMIEGVAVVNAEERVLFVNPAFAHILGLDPVAEMGRPLVELVRDSELLGLVKHAIAERATVSGEVVIGTVRQRSFAVTASPVQAEDSSGAVLVLHEVTEQRRLERVRRDFVANVSHEFKTPLTAIQGFAETLLGGALDDQHNRRRFVEIIRDHALRLARLTDDLLRLSLIEIGKLEFHIEPVSASALIESCVETARLKASQKQLTVRMDCPAQLPLVLGDANRLLEVLQNLLDNAIQYTPAGGQITVRAQAAEQEVILTVADTGIGIPQAEQERIFERFYRVDAARSREVGGTGLGLSIARHIVQAHGGRIWVESAVGQGSRFHFSVPLAA